MQYSDIFTPTIHTHFTQLEKAVTQWKQLESNNLQHEIKSCCETFFYYYQIIRYLQVGGLVACLKRLEYLINRLGNIPLASAHSQYLTPWYDCAQELLTSFNHTNI